MTGQQPSARRRESARSFSGRSAVVTVRQGWDCQRPRLAVTRSRAPDARSLRVLHRTSLSISLATSPHLSPLQPRRRHPGGSIQFMMPWQPNSSARKHCGSNTTHAHHDRYARSPSHVHRRSPQLMVSLLCMQIGRRTCHAVSHVAGTSRSFADQLGVVGAL